MQSEVRAVIDVGTNSVKLLVADVEGAVIRPLHEASQQTRLGQGFYETRVLRPGAIDQTAKAVAEFATEAQAWTPAVLKVIATSAARDAINKEQLIGALEAAAAVRVDVVTGSQEAELAFRGVTSDPQLAGKNLLVMDVGGGSSEFILGSCGHAAFTESFPIGSVRLLEKFSVSDPPKGSERSQCEEEVRGILENGLKPHLTPHLERLNGELELVGTGGTSTILARMKSRLRSFSRELIEGTFLSRPEMEFEIMRLWNMPLEQRRQIVGLPPNRADVILTGAIIFHEVMKTFCIETLRVSTRGLRFAALMD